MYDFWWESEQQQEEDQQQILNSNDMSETHCQKCLFAPKLPTKYLELSKKIPDRSILSSNKPKFERLILWWFTCFVQIVNEILFFVFVIRSGNTISGSQLVQKT